MYYLDTRPFDKKKVASIDIFEDFGNVVIGVNYYLTRHKKDQNYKTCYGAWKPENAIEIGNDIINIASNILNKEN